LAGGEDLFQLVRKRFPASVCNLGRADKMATALQQAVGVEVILVDSRLLGAEDLCQRLRMDPLTSQIPLVCIVQAADDVPRAPANAQVEISEIDRLEQTLLLFCPALDREPPAAAAPAQDAPPPRPRAEAAPEDEGVFDDEATTVAYRRPTAEPGMASEWPPPPPTRQPSQDTVTFSQNFAGYMNSLIEALQSPDKLSQDEKNRLESVADLTLNDVEVLLGDIQTPINASLMEKNLVQMRLLSSAKNSIYGKRRSMQGLISKLDKSAAPPQPAPPVLKEAASPAAAPSPQPPPTPQDAVPEGTAQPAQPPEDPGARPAVSASPSGNSTAPGGASPSGTYAAPTGPHPKPKKSELTLRAEAMEAERRQAIKDARKTGKLPAQKVQRQAYRTAVKPRSKVGYGWIWIPVAAIMVLAFILMTVHYLKLSAEEDKKVKKSKNNPPEMKWVILEQTSAGILARPQAQDKEGDRISFNIRWYINGEEHASAITARLRPTDFKPGDTVYAVVKASDSKGVGQPMRSRDITANDLVKPKKKAP